MSANISFQVVGRDQVDALATIYKEVFEGYPWYEDKVCSGVLLESSEKCAIQYTSRTLPEEYAWSLDLEKRSGVVGSVDVNNIKSCRVCRKPLIDFYPEYIDQRKLIVESLEKKAFTGFFAQEEKEAMGFAWGYQVPLERTIFVDFPKALPFLESFGVDREDTFYWSEVGIVERMQRRGIGKKLSQALLSRAREQDFTYLALRTKNEAVIKILRESFPGQEIFPRFTDAERGTPWYLLEFGGMKT